MQVKAISDFHRGWFIGDFEPSVLRTAGFEVGYLTHKKGEYWAPHYHAIATEINYLIRGKIGFADKIIEAGSVFVFEPNEVAAPVFLEDCELIVVKTPSCPKDKYEIN